MSPSDSESRLLFGLPEYDQTQSEFVHNGVRKLMEAKDKIFRSMSSSDPRESVPTSQNTLESGAVVQNAPVEMVSVYKFSFDEIRECSEDRLAIQMNEAAEESLKVAMTAIFGHIANVSAAAGTTVNARGRPFSHELLMEVLENLEIDFDENGEPKMPTMVVHPDMVPELRRLPPATEEQMKAHAELIERKRQQHNDRKRSRKLH